MKLWRNKLVVVTVIIPVAFSDGFVQVQKCNYIICDYNRAISNQIAATFPTISSAILHDIARSMKVYKELLLSK